MNEQQKNVLLKTAKEAVTAAVEKRKPELSDSDDPALNQKCGCFVTLKTDGKLRGCLGQFTSDEPIIQLIAKTAQSSATRDPRFVTQRIQPDELNDVDIEISVLSPLEKTDQPENLRLGTDGIYITDGRSSGCFLPQVATETGWNTQEFLSYCCSHKAGLSPEAWKSPDVDVFLFSAEVFSKPYNQI
jgi:AmmeMemoRadiSam system protein A